MVEKKARVTDDLESGKSVSVNDYILRASEHMGLFYGKFKGQDITKMDMQEVIARVKSSTVIIDRHIENLNVQIKDLRKQIETNDTSPAKDLTTDNVLRAMINIAIRDLQDWQAKLEKQNRDNALAELRVRALYENLPGGNAVPVFGAKSGMPKPDEMAFLFGSKYRGLENESINPAVRLKRYEAINKHLSSSEKDSFEMLTLPAKKIRLEKLNMLYYMDSTIRKEDRYDGMIDKVSKWSPKYEHENKNIQYSVVDYLDDHKLTAVSLLKKGKMYGCPSQEQKIEEEKASKQRIKRLQEMSSPDELVNELQQSIGLHIERLGKQVSVQKLKKQIIWGPSALYAMKAAPVQADKSL